MAGQDMSGSASSSYQKSCNDSLGTGNRLAGNREEVGDESFFRTNSRQYPVLLYMRPCSAMPTGEKD